MQGSTATQPAPDASGAVTQATKILFLRARQGHLHTGITPSPLVKREQGSFLKVPMKPNLMKDKASRALLKEMLITISTDGL